MVNAGKLDNAIQFISALPHKNAEMAIGPIISQHIESGDAEAVQSLSQQFDLDKSKYGRFQMLENMFKANLKAKNLVAAEKLAREAYKLGLDIDINGAPGIWQDSQIAKLVIWHVMGAGMTDLGFELYRQSSVQDASMLTAAFNDQITRLQVTSILVLAYDTLTGYEREKVFNHAYSWTLDNDNLKS